MGHHILRDNLRSANFPDFAMKPGQDHRTQRKLNTPEKSAD
jgi:hypothetical protein